jgi:hypothetical protein
MDRVAIAWTGRSSRTSATNATTIDRDAARHAVLGFEISPRGQTPNALNALGEMLTTELAAGEQLRTVPGETVTRRRLNWR